MRLAHELSFLVQNSLEITFFYLSLIKTLNILI